MNLPILEMRRQTGDMIKTFKFLNETDYVESTQFFETKKEKSTKVHKKEVSKKKKL